MMIDLAGKTAIVSGSSAGIGFAIVTRLLAAGATVVLNGRDLESVDRALNNLSAEQTQGRGWRLISPPQRDAAR